MTDIAPWNMKFNTNHKLFDWIYSLVIEEGGDGDAVIGFKYQNYKEVAKLFSALAKSIDAFGREHGKKGTTGGFSGPFAMRIMASLQKYIDGEDIEVVCDRLLSIEQLNKKKQAK